MRNSLAFWITRSMTYGFGASDNQGLKLERGLAAYHSRHRLDRGRGQLKRGP